MQQDIFGINQLCRLLHSNYCNLLSKATPGFFNTFASMITQVRHINFDFTCHLVITDMTDCYTWSFPEFIPFCSNLYDFSSFKRFETNF